jgi:hypothetical protein
MRAWSGKDVERPPGRSRFLYRVARSFLASLPRLMAHFSTRPLADSSQGAVPTFASTAPNSVSPTPPPSHSLRGFVTSPTDQWLILRAHFAESDFDPSNSVLCCTSDGGALDRTLCTKDKIRG